MSIEFFRYFFVSLVAFAVDLAVFSIGIRLIGLSWIVSATISFSTGLLIAYYLSVRYVFRFRTLQKHPTMELISFSAIGLAGLLLTQAILWVGIEWLTLQPEFARVAAAAINFFFNFAIRKALLFSASAHRI